MKVKANSKQIYKNKQILKKKSRKQKYVTSQRPVDHPTADEDNYLRDIYSNQELIDYREPDCDGKEYLPTGSVEDRDEDSEVPDNDQMDDNYLNNEPEIPLEELQVVPGHYKIKKRPMEVEEDDEQAVANVITSSNPVRYRVKKDKIRRYLIKIYPQEIIMNH